MTRDAEHTPSPQSVVVPKFGAVVENGWASEDNPTRRGFFVREFKRTGKLNPGRTWEITDGKGKFWEFKPSDIGERLSVSAAPAPSSLAGGAGVANHDCLAKRREGEPMFILLGRDPDAHTIVQLWADRRLAAGGDPDHCRMGYDTAERMAAYASDPANRPASAPPASDYPILAALSPEAPAREGVELTNEQIQAVMLAAIKEVRATVTDATEGACMDADIIRMERGLVDMGDTGWAVMRAVHQRLSALTPRHEAPAEGAGERDADILKRWANGDLLMRPERVAEVVKRVLPALQRQSQPLDAELHRLASQEADHLEREAEEADDNNWQDWAVTMRQAAGYIRQLIRARSSAPEAREREVVDHRPECWGSTSYSGEMAHCYCSQSTAAPSADKLRIDLWWNAEDWETTFDNIEDAYEAATGGYCVGVARLGRATEHDAVWAAMIDIDTTGDGEADDREIRLFATEDEARQALAALKGDAK